MFNTDGSAQTYQNGIHQGRHVTLLFKPTHESVQTTFVIGNINNLHFVTQETQKVLVLRAIEYGNEFLNALDKEGKETEAARALMQQAFDEGAE
ncbi:MAG: hypothetical protein MRQ13_04535 [Candidatus Midichloria sp.]|nr:hypothetical protein [Candidatus Midichloria sp.]